MYKYYERITYIYIYFFLAMTLRPNAGHSLLILHSWGFLDYTQRHTTFGRTPLDEWSARRRDLYLTTHNTHNRQISMAPVRFEPTISAGERPQTYALDRAATGTGITYSLEWLICPVVSGKSDSFISKEVFLDYVTLEVQKKLFEMFVLYTIIHVNSGISQNAQIFVSLQRDSRISHR